MNDFPVPLKILDRSSKVKKLLENNNLKNGDFKILIGENRGPLMIDLDLVGHLLVSGWSQSGKELILDAMIQSVMLQYRPDEARMILFDTQADFSQYDKSNPYLLTEVIHDWIKVISALKWSQGEKVLRYRLFRENGVRYFYEYNEKAREKIPRIVIFIKTVDEIISEAKELLMSLIEKGRNVGIHLILVTNKISKINTPPDLLSQLPNRIICQTTSEEDSIATGASGAHTLSTDQFYLLLFQEKPVRFTKIMINKFDIKNIGEYFKSITPVISYTENINSPPDSESEEKDPLFNGAVNVIKEHDFASASLLQRRLSIGYARAARLLDQLETDGIVGPTEGSKPRKVLKNK